jgi:hypothetical protein
MKMDLFKKYLLATAARFAPPNEGVEGNEGETDGLESEVADEGGEVAAGEDEGQGDQGDSEGVDEEGQEGEVDAQPARKPSRAQSRIQTLTRTLAEEKTERQRIDRELADLRAEQRARQQQTQQESPEAKAARRALMDPLELMREDLKESEARTQNLLHQQALQTQETQDKLTYNGILREAPHLKKYEAEVEKIRLEQVARGVFVPREVLLDLAIGRTPRAAAVKAGTKPAKQAQARVDAQRARPAGARGDAATVRGKQGDSPEKRLENVPI